METCGALDLGSIAVGNCSHVVIGQIEVTPMRYPDLRFDMYEDSRICCRIQTEEMLFDALEHRA